MSLERKGAYALVTVDYPPLKGGVARYLSQIVAQSGREIDVFVDRGQSTEGPGYVRSWSFFFSVGPFRWLKLIALFWELKRAGYRQVLVSHVLPIGTVAWISSILFGLKYTLFVHGMDVQLAKQHPRRRSLARRILLGANHVIANSKYVASLAREIDVRISVEVMTPGVEVRELVSRDVARAELLLSASERIILAVGRLVSRKGFDVLVDALSGLTNVRLVVIGDGPERERLVRLAHGRSVRMDLISDADDVVRDRWYAASDVFVLPVREEQNGTDIEGFGMVFLEAAAAGLSVVAGRTKATEEAVQDGVTGVLVESRSDEVRAAIQSLLNDPMKAREMGEKGRERVRTAFTWSERWKRLSELLR